MAVFEARKQYAHLLSYKYNIPYTWFQPNALNAVDLLLFDIPQKGFPAFLQIFLFESFAGAGVSSADLSVKTERDGIIDSDSSLYFAEFDLFQPVTNYSGLQKAIPERDTTPTPFSLPVSLPRSKSANIYMSLKLNNPSTMDDLTAGFFGIWFTTFRNI